jgi:hypothetical protein
LLSGVDWKNPPPLQKLFSHSARGLAPLSEVNRFFRGSGPPMTQAEYDAAVNQLREILPKTVYQPGPGVDKLYRDLGLAVPEYTPTEKTQLRVLREPEEPGFARGGAVTAPPGPAQYDPLAIDSLAEQLLMEA